MPNTLFPRIAVVLTHMKTLRKRQTQLDGEIAVEQNRLDSNYQHLHWLKVRRLMVADQIQRYDAILQKLKEALLNSGAGKAALT